MKAAKAAVCRNKANGIVQQKQWNRSANPLKSLNDSIAFVPGNRQLARFVSAVLKAGIIGFHGLKELQTIRIELKCAGESEENDCL